MHSRVHGICIPGGAFEIRCDQGTSTYVAVFIVLHAHAFALSCSYNYILMNVTDLMEMDYMFTKVMLYMSPHKDLYVVLQKVDPILATSFYIWYIETYEKELLTKGTKDLVTVHKTSVHFGLIILF